MYEYKAEVLRVIDGDTIEIRVDLGFSVFVVDRVRLLRIDAYETRLSSTTTQEMKNLGLAGKAYLNDLIMGKVVLIRTIKDKTEKYGRYLAEVFYSKNSDGIYDTCISDEMVTQGFAVYMTM